MSILIIATLVSSAAVQAVANEGELTLDIDASDEATLQVVQRWEGQEAADMRQSLDALFGDDDGRLSPSELEAIAEATARDLGDQTFPMVDVDGEVAMVTSADVSFENVQGPVDNTDEMTMVHDLTLEVPESEDGERTVTLTPIWPAEIDVQTPDGWRVDDTENLEDVQEQEGGVQGQAEADVEVTITFVVAEEEAVGVPGLGVVALLVAVGLLALVLARRKGR